MNKVQKTKISFHFHPLDFKDMNHVVEKMAIDGSGIKSQHLMGVSSGIKLDGHEERMTEKCIQSFMNQANSGDILLYADVHGIKASEDIGILTKAEIQLDGNWYTEYRLYNESDDIGAVKKEKIDTIWKQLNGLPPYTKPKEKGFSVEGYIPTEGIISSQTDQFGNVGKRIIDDVFLDGVIIVPRPAYADSIATAVYKALGELTPNFESNLRKSIQGELQTKLQQEELNDVYYKKRWDLRDALDSQIEKIMSRPNDIRKQEQLKVLFDEYSSLTINLLMQSEFLFINDEEQEQVFDQPYGRIEVAKDSKLELFQSLMTQLQQIKKSLVR